MRLCGEFVAAAIQIEFLVPLRHPEDIAEDICRSGSLRLSGSLI